MCCAAGGLANVREEMPFELQALEIVLDVVRNNLEAEGYNVARGDMGSIRMQLCNPACAMGNNEGL